MRRARATSTAKTRRAARPHARARFVASAKKLAALAKWVEDGGAGVPSVVGASEGDGKGSGDGGGVGDGEGGEMGEEPVGRRVGVDEGGPEVGCAVGASVGICEGRGVVGVAVGVVGRQITWSWQSKKTNGKDN